MILRKAEKNDYVKIKKLYNRSFPRNERTPFFMIKRNGQNGKADMLTSMDKDEIIGFMYLVCYVEFVYLFYFAIDEKERGKGYLAREQLDESADNYEQRVKRREFYLKNGFEDLPYRLKEAGEVYDVMSVGGSVSAKDYDALITNWCGKFIRKIVDMRFIEKRD